MKRQNYLKRLFVFSVVFWTLLSALSQLSDHFNVVNDEAMHFFIYCLVAFWIILMYRYVKKYEKSKLLQIDNLEKSERRFQLIFSNASVGICLINPEGNFVDFNDKMLDIVGYDKKELVLLTFKDITHSDDHVIDDACYATIINGKSECPHEKRYIRKNGEIVWVNVMASVIRDKNGEIEQFLAIVENISERREIENRQRRDENLILEAQRIAKLGSWELDLKSNIVLFSDEMKKILECVKCNENCQVVNVLEHIHPDDRKLFEWGLDSIMKSNDMACEQSLRLRMPDGRIKYIHQRTRVVMNEKNEVARIIAAVTDVSGIKKNEDMIIMAQKMDSIRTLAGGIAHDFNNFLTIIIGSTSLIRLRNNQPDLVDRYAQNIENASEAATGLSKQLLTFAKGGDPVKVVCDLNRIISNTVNLSLRGQAIKAELRLDSTLWLVEVDEHQIVQVISNLVINAIQAMSSQGVLRVESENCEIFPGDDLPLKRGRYAKVKVEDTGAGISADELNRIFDPFFTTKQDGNGLGLAVVYSIINKHKGHIMADSLLGVGTTFTFLLPVSIDQSKLPVSGKKLDDVTARNLKVLVMDDDALVGATLCGLLSACGHSSILVPHGDAMLECYRQECEAGNTFDLVILDLTITGGLGGRESIVKLLKYDPAAKAVVCSGYSNDQVMAHYLSFGFIGCITKPVNLGSLKEFLSTLK